MNLGRNTSIIKGMNMQVIDKLNARINKTNSLLCVGLDSELSRIPEAFQKEGTHKAQFAFKRQLARLSNNTSEIPPRSRFSQENP